MRKRAKEMLIRALRGVVIERDLWERTSPATKAALRQLQLARMARFGEIADRPWVTISGE